MTLKKSYLFEFSESDVLGITLILIEMVRWKRELEFMDDKHAYDISVNFMIYMYICIYICFLQKSQWKSYDPRTTNLAPPTFHKKTLQICFLALTYPSVHMENSRSVHKQVDE